MTTTSIKKIDIDDKLGDIGCYAAGMFLETNVAKTNYGLSQNLTCKEHLSKACDLAHDFIVEARKLIKELC